MTDDVRQRDEARAAAGQDVPAAGQQVEAPRPDEVDATEGMAVESRSQWQLFRRKFVRHKLAMGSLLFLLLVSFAAFNAEWVAPYEYDEINVVMRSTPPTLEQNHFFGTDQLGRDYFSRVLYGTRTSLIAAGVAGIIAVIVGTTIGAVAGFYRGWIDSLLMRLTDLVLIVPLLAILLVAATFFGRGQPVRVAVIIGLLVWVSLARIVRGVFLSLREKEFVQAARASGATDLRIIFRHMLPNTVGPIVVNLTLTLAAVIILEATLAFLGLGVNPPEPALGLLIEEGRSAMQTQWWLILMPGLTLVAIALAINFVGDGLRDALDPTQRES